MMLENSPKKLSRMNGEERDANEAEPGAERAVPFRLKEKEVEDLVTYVALRGKVEHEELALLKSLPGLATSALGTLSSFLGGANTLSNGDGNNKAMTGVTKAASTASASATILNSGYRLGQKAREGYKAVARPEPGGDYNNLTANYLWKRFERIIQNNEFGMKGINRRVAVAAAQPAVQDGNAQHPVIEDTARRVREAEILYADLELSLGKLFVPAKRLIEADSLDSFKKLLVVSGI